MMLYHLIQRGIQLKMCEMKCVLGTDEEEEEEPERIQ